MQQLQILDDALVLGFDQSGREICYFVNRYPFWLYAHFLSFITGQDKHQGFFRIKGQNGPSVPPKLLENVIKRGGGSINEPIFCILRGDWESDNEYINRALQIRSKLLDDYSAKVVKWIGVFLLLTEEHSRYVMPEDRRMREESLPIKMTELQELINHLGGESDKKIISILQGKSNKQSRQWRKAQEVQRQIIEHNDWPTIEWLKMFLFNPVELKQLSLEIV